MFVSQPAPLVVLLHHGRHECRRSHCDHLLELTQLFPLRFWPSFNFIPTQVNTLRVYRPDTERCSFLVRLAVTCMHRQQRGSNTH
jgi:hypothetical protein